MARSQGLREVVARVNEWAMAVIKLQSSGIGYPDHAPIAEINGGSKRPAGPIVPNVQFNARVAEVNRAMRELDGALASLIRHKHLSENATDLELAREFCRAYGISLATYYRREKDAYMWLSGWLSRQVA